MENNNAIYIDCECGTHSLRVENNVDYLGDDNERVYQSIYLAMFSYGSFKKKPTFWRRIGVIWNYFKTGEMHSDQLTLNVNETQKLINFLNSNIIKTKG